MSLEPPPAAQPAGVPVIEPLPSGTLLHRVHHRDHAADSFNPTAAPSARAGGRFDSRDGSYACTYLGAEPAAALAETLCRDLPTGASPRLVPYQRLAGRVLSQVRTDRALQVLSLHGADLAHVGATLDLTKSPSRTYLLTRGWAAALRTWLPDVAGFAYRCRHDEDLVAYALFDDGPCASDLRARGALSVVPGSGVPLESLEGQAEVLEVLRRHNATLGPPPAPPPPSATIKDVSPT